MNTYANFIVSAFIIYTYANFVVYLLHKMLAGYPDISHIPITHPEFSRLDQLFCVTIDQYITSVYYSSLIDIIKNPCILATSEVVLSKTMHFFSAQLRFFLPAQPD